MRLPDEIASWLADHILRGIFKEYFGCNLKLPGLGGAFLSLVAASGASISVRMIWWIIEPTPEPDWYALNPNDNEQMQKTFSDKHVVVKLAHELEENTASTLIEMTDQIRRLDRFGKASMLYRIDVTNEELLRQVFWRKTQHRSGSETQRRWTCAFAERVS
jgi:hypothetical protein